jgi:hypothetical protein
MLMCGLTVGETSYKKGTIALSLSSVSWMNLPLIEVNLPDVALLDRNRQRAAFGEWLNGQGRRG